MKKQLLRTMTLIVAMGTLAACNNNDDEMTSPAYRILKVGASIPGNAQTRTTIGVTDPYNINPDFTKGEEFFWEDSEKFCALVWDESSKSGIENIGSTSVSSTKKEVFFDVTIPGTFAAGSCRVIYPSLTIVSKQTVTMDIEDTQEQNDFYLYNYMYTDVLPFDAESEGLPNARFHHQSALLRFNVLNLTTRPYVIKDIKVGYYDGNDTPLQTVIPAALTFDLLDCTTTNKNFHSTLTWQNKGYKRAAPMIDDETTTDKHEGVFDAMMVTLPTARQTTGQFVVTMTLYDKEAETEFTPTPLRVNCIDYDFLSGETNGGFKAGERTYFCIDITEDNTLRLKGVSVADWGSSSTIEGGDAELESNA